MTDITEHPTGEGKLCLCAVKDCSSKVVVGSSIDSRTKSSLVAAALGKAIAVWMETKHNRQRRQGGLGKQSPVEFKRSMRLQRRPKDC